MAPEEVASRSYKLYPTTDQAAKYECTAILKASDFSEVDRAECQFTTTSTVLDNGSQITSPYEPTSWGINGFFESIEKLWSSIWNGIIDFFTGKSCRSRCSGFFDFSCHIQYICFTWIVLFGLLLAIVPTVVVLLWLLHQKGFFDPLHDWWENRFGSGTQRDDVRRGTKARIHNHEGIHHHSHQKTRHHGHDALDMQMVHHTSHGHHKRRHSISMEKDDVNHTHDRHVHVHKEKHKHQRISDSRLENRGRSSSEALPLVTREKQHTHPEL